MGPIHYVEVLVFAVAVSIVAERIRVLLFEAPVDTKPYLAAVGAALEAGDLDRARAIGEAGKDAWVPQLVRLALTEDGEADLLERLLDLRAEAFRRLYVLRVFASMGTPLGFLGAMGALIWLKSCDHGILDLQAGLSQKIAMQDAMLAMLLGLVISVFSIFSLRVLKKAAFGLHRDLGQATELMERHGYGLDLREPEVDPEAPP